MHSDAFEVIGGHRLKGDLQPQGAKNEALQILCVPILSTEDVTIHNIPNISDVNKLMELLKGLGVTIKHISEGSYIFNAKNIDTDYLDSKEFRDNAKRIRGSVMLIGPLLARFGRAFLPQPGGDKIGRRRLDTHFLAFEKLGAEFKFNEEKNQYTVETKIGRAHV